MYPKDADGMANSVDPDQTAPLGAVWSGSTLFALTSLSQYLELLWYSMWKFQPHNVLLRLDRVFSMVLVTLAEIFLTSLA